MQSRGPPSLQSASLVANICGTYTRQKNLTAKVRTIDHRSSRLLISKLTGSVLYSRYRKTQALFDCSDGVESSLRPGLLSRPPSTHIHTFTYVRFWAMLGRYAQSQRHESIWGP